MKKKRVETFRNIRYGDGHIYYILGECLTLLASGSDPFDYLSEQFNVSTHHY